MGSLSPTPGRQEGYRDQQATLRRSWAWSCGGLPQRMGEELQRGTVELIDAAFAPGQYQALDVVVQQHNLNRVDVTSSMGQFRGLHQPVSSQRVPKGKGDDGNVYERHRATRDERHNPVNDRLPTGVERFLSAFNQKFSQLFSSPGPGHENVQASSGPHQPEGGAYDGSQLTPK
ncbi:unnamed protein product [Parascedosporium putredinis]|uniref:Uncharacterized protein n=1 Tax=Parascedosporium putredinis TaxID=1442378 RepID=A0A9P1GYK8_9PEZI|nr:unnamed protein product [Parascedosporium putredinis]CAI7990094.1 unnamed protein product [Parascedosporium putredinis]